MVEQLTKIVQKHLQKMAHKIENVSQNFRWFAVPIFCHNL